MDQPSTSRTNPVISQHGGNKHREAWDQLNKKGLMYYTMKIYDKAIEFHEKALELASDNNDEELRSESIQQIASSYREWKKYDRAIKNLNDVVGLAAKRRKFALQLDALEQLGKVCQKNIKDLQQILPFSGNEEQIKRLQYQADEYERKRHILLEEANDKTDEHRRKKHKLMEEEDDGQESPSALELGKMHYRHGDFEAAKANFQRVCDDIRSEDPTKRFRSFMDLANTNFILEEYQEAIDYYKEALSLIPDINQQQERILIRYNLYQSYLALDDNEQALDNLMFFRFIMEKLCNKDDLLMAYNSLRDLYSRICKFSVAGQFNALFSRLSNDIHQAKKSGNDCGIEKSIESSNLLYDQKSEEDDFRKWKEENFTLEMQITSKPSEDELQIFNERNVTAFHLMEERDFSGAQILFHQNYHYARKVLRSIKDEMNSVFNIGITSRKTAGYPQSIEYFNKALDLAIIIGNEKMEREILLNLGKTNEEQARQIKYTNPSHDPRAVERQLWKAMRYFKKCLLIECVEQEPENAIQSIAGIYKELDDYKNAIIWYKKSLELSRNEKPQYSDISALRGIAGCLVISQELGKAAEYFMKAIEIAEKCEFSEEIVKWYMELGSLYEHLREFPQAIDIYKRLLENIRARNIDNLLVVAHTYLRISGVYYQMQNFELAYEYSSDHVRYAEILGDTIGMNMSTQNSNLYKKLIPLTKQGPSNSRDNYRPSTPNSDHNDTDTTTSENDSEDDENLQIHFDDDSDD